MKFSHLGLIVAFLGMNHLQVLALPPPDDIPEEVLIKEIIIDARSNIDNKSLTVTEYNLEQEKEDNSLFPPDVDSRIKQNIFYINILKMFRTITPF